MAVEIDFIHSTVSNVDGETIVSETAYMLKREVEEKPEGDRPNRTQERVSLYQRTSAGAKPIETAESRLSQMLPKEMIDIFFTDGDAAMTFISPQLSDNAKRDKVKEAIRSLLGLDLLERVTKRVSTAQSAVNRSISKDASSDRLTEVSEKIERLIEKKGKVAASVTTLNSQIVDLDHKRVQVTRELARALEGGNFEHLAHQRETFKKQFDTAKEEIEQLKRDHQELFQRESLSWGLIGPSLRKGFDLLVSLHAKGVIPRAAVPILKERLELKKCICGAALTEGSEAHAHVTALIEEQRPGDSQVDYLSTLYYQAKSELETWQSPESKPWTEESSKLQKRRLGVNKRLETANRELQSVEAKLDQIDEEEIEIKRNYEKTLEASLRQRNSELDRANVTLVDTEEKLRGLKSEQKGLSQADERLTRLNAEKTALDDLQTVIDGTLEEMQGKYLKQVSDRMNVLFLTMVGADPDQNAVFQGAEINEKYSIVVRTMDDRTLNPDYEVNGASQRALTFAFIWALTEVSGVVAPRVIDTPLGMMSGNVKRRVLEMVSKAAGDEVDRQVILFLTQSEIAHTEDILDKQSGTTMTLTKTDDYPADLMNDPRAEQSEVRMCVCTHRQYCDQCQRTNYEDFKLEYRTA